MSARDFDNQNTWLNGYLNEDEDKNTVIIPRNNNNNKRRFRMSPVVFNYDQNDGIGRY